MDIFATIFSAGVPQNGLTDDPEIQITDDAGTIVQAFVAMTDLVVAGHYVRAFTIPDVARNYTFLVDADPNATAQVPSSDRYYFGAFSGEADIIAVSTDLANLDVAVSTRSTPAQISASEATIIAAIAALNNISITDVRTALTNQGYTTVRAALLDNLDAAVSSRNAVTPMTAALSQTEHDATQAAIAAQVVPLAAAVDQAEHDATQAAIAAQVVPLEASVDQAEHDATQSQIAALVVPMDVATSQAEHDATQVGIGLNLAAVGALNDISVGDILTAVLSSGNTVDAELSGILAMRDFIEGGRDIDFVGDDVLGWQRIERSVAGGLLRRYNLFDEGGSRINETVASFIGRSGMISAEVAI